MPILVDFRDRVSLGFAVGVAFYCVFLSLILQGTRKVGLIYNHGLCSESVSEGGRVFVSSNYTAGVEIVQADPKHTRTIQ